MHKVPILRKKG